MTDEVDLSAEQTIRQSGPGWQAYVLSVNGAVLYDLYARHKNALFSANLRDFLGTRKASGNVNNRIKETAEKAPGNFFVFNNGITLVTKKADLQDKHLRLSWRFCSQRRSNHGRSSRSWSRACCQRLSSSSNHRGR